MFGRITVLMVPLLLVVVWLARRSGRSQRTLELDPSRQAVVIAGHRTAFVWRWVGLVIGVVAAALTASVGVLGLGVMLAPTVFGLAVVGGVVVGELATIPRREGVRSAALETRTVGDYLPRRLGGLVAGSTIGLGALLFTTTLMGSADDLGRAGRSLSRQCSPDTFASAGPWPGLYYSGPLAIAVVVGLLLAAVALHTVVLRPRSGSAPELVAADDVLRRRSAESVVAATGVMVAASMLGVALTAGGRLTSFHCAPRAWTILGVALLGVGALMLLLAVWCLAVLLSGPRVRRLASADRAASDRKASR